MHKSVHQNKQQNFAGFSSEAEGVGNNNSPENHGGIYYILFRNKAKTISDSILLKWFISGFREKTISLG